MTHGLYPSYSIAAVRRLLVQAFAVEDLRRFVGDRPEFSALLTRFAPSDGLEAMAEKVVEFCRTQILFDELLAAIKADNPRAYEVYGVREGLPEEPGKKPVAGDGTQVWLEKNRLGDNPFKDWAADNEPHLTKYFVPSGDFEKLLQEARPCLVFAGRGCGKTAQRRMLAAECRPINRGVRSLAISYGYAGVERALRLAGGDVDRVEAGHHVAVLLHEALKLLEDECRRVPEQDTKLKSSTVRPCLADYAARFAPHLALAADGQASSLAEMGSVELLQGMTRLLQDAELGPCMVLMDGLDEFPAAAGDPGYAARFLSTLLGTLDLLRCPGWAFRFFLPQGLEAALRACSWFRPDRMALIRLAWNQDKIAALFAERLRHYTKLGEPLTSLEQLCDQDKLAPVVMKQLVELAAGRPRAALVLAFSLIQEHCRRPDPERRIGPDAWEQVKEDWERRRADFGLDAPISAYPILRLDEKGGFVWLGERDIRGGITAQDYQVLACLYRHAREVCSRDQIAREAWPHEKDVEGVSDQSMAAAIARLRRVLEKYAPEAGYIETVRSKERDQGGYRLYPEGFEHKGGAADGG